MAPPNWNELELRSFSYSKLKSKKEYTVIGFDTETINGYAKLITDSNGRYLLIDEKTSNTDALERILDFLTYRPYKSSLNFFYNIRYDFQSIIKYLTVGQLYELWVNKEIVIDFNNTEMKLFYIPKKALELEYRKKRYYYFDIAQFFNHNTLEYNARKYLGMKKNEGGLDINKIGSDVGYWKKYKQEIIKYCVNDSILTKKLAEFYYNHVRQRPISINSRSWYSQASLAEVWLRNNCYIPDPKKMHDNWREIYYYAYNSYHGGRFEVLKKGSIGYCYHYDINSAYPCEISNLIDISKGVWCKIEGEILEDAYYGFIRGRYRGKKKNIVEPVMVYDKFGVGVFPHYTDIVFITLEEYKYITDNQLGEFEVIDGWFYTPAYILHPFHKMREMYELRKKLKKEKNELELGIKLILNSTYGKFFQKHYDVKKKKFITGRLFNPVYASIITANTRLKLLELGHFKDAVSYSTDSVIFKREIDILTDNELGGWKKDKEGDTIVIGSGIYKIGDEYRTRALSQINPKELLQQIKNDGYNDEIEINIKHVVTLAECLSNSEYSKEDLNKFKFITKSLNVNFDTKRDWDYNFKSFNEIFEKEVNSKPWMFI